MFEGTYDMFWKSMSTLLTHIPSDTVVYCAHEYTQKNAEFALSVDPDNSKLQQRYKEVVELRKQNIPTIPFLFQSELDTNPFIRPKALGPILGIKNEVDIFAEVRKRKDNF